MSFINKPLDREKFLKKLDIFGFITSALGVVFKLMYFPFASLLIIFGFSFLAQGSIHKVQLNSTRIDVFEKIVEKVGIISSSFGFIGLLFKIQIWPYAEIMLWAFFISIFAIFFLSIWKQINFLKIIPSIEQYKILGCLILCLIFA